MSIAKVSSEPIEPRYLRTPDAARYVGCRPRNLEAMRQRNDGPLYVKLSRGLLVYDVRDLDAWVQSHRHKSEGSTDE